MLAPEDSLAYNWLIGWGNKTPSDSHQTKTKRSSIMNTNNITPVPAPAPTAFDQFLAASTAAWDDYEAALAVAQEVQDALVSAGSSVRKAYDAMQWRRNAAANALGDALAVASAEYSEK